MTGQGKLLKTEDQNINFIFHDPYSDDLYDVLYENLPYIMVFSVQVILESYACILKVNEQTVSHLIFVTMGCYEALFLKKTPQFMARALSKALRPFLTCIHCKASLRLTRNNALEMYLRESLLCHKCGLPSPFPLYWLMGTANFKIERLNGGSPIIDEPGSLH